MAILHNGFIDKKFHDSFKDSTLNDFDLATTRVYKGVKPMWEQLGFDSDTQDNPENLTYWKNIIPQDYNFFDIDGIETRDVDKNGDVGVEEGSKIPRNSYKKIIIDEEIAQNWRGEPTPYYPVLPRLDRYGNFTDIVDEQLIFGSKETWDGDDSAPITNFQDDDINLIFNLIFDGNTTNDIFDSSGLCKTEYVSDFQVKLGNDNRIQEPSSITVDPVEKNNIEQAF